MSQDMQQPPQYDTTYHVGPTTDGSILPDHARELAAKDAEIARLREALVEIKELVITLALLGNDSQRALSESIHGIITRAALEAKHD